MPDRSTDDAWLKELLGGSRRVAVVGASADPDRDSYRIFSYLQQVGFQAVPVNPAYSTVGVTPTVPHLASAANRFDGIDIVDVFRAPQHLPAIVDEVLQLGTKPVLWLQFGVVHEEAIQKALDAGLDVVVDRCIKVEHQRLVAA